MLVAATVTVLALLVQGAGIRATATVDPDTAVVGQPVTLTVRVTVPRGAQLTFPLAVDSTGVFEPLDPVSVTRLENGNGDFVATYRLLAWRPGALEVSIGPIDVHEATGVRRLIAPAPHLFVKSVLPTDTAFRVPKQARPPILLPPSRLALYVALLAAAAMGMAALWLMRRRSRRSTPPSDPFAEAQRAFGRLAALDLIDAGEPTKHVAAATAILRDFLVAYEPRAERGLAGHELATAVAHNASVPAKRVEAFFAGSNAVRFAPDRPDPRTAESLGAEAQAIVAETHRAARQHEKAT